MLVDIGVGVKVMCPDVPVTRQDATDLFVVVEDRDSFTYYIQSVLNNAVELP